MVHSHLGISQFILWDWQRTAHPGKMIQSEKKMKWKLEREREMISRDLRQGTGMQKPQRTKVTDHEVPEQKVTFTDQGVWLWWWGTKWHPLESVSRCP